jgi:uncharacterized membrane protein YkoI
MSTRNRFSLAALVLALGVASGVAAQSGPVTVKEEKKGMFKLAKITPAEAIKTAQAQFPSATIKSGELEKEDGKLIYTFDMQQPGMKGIEEVNVDANTGAVIKTEHENPAPPKRHATRSSVKRPPTA